MLVLSRKETDKILFPSLGVTIEVLRIRGNVARLGIDAPDEVPIRRHEIADLKELEFAADEDPGTQLRRLIYALRQRLGAATDTLNRLHQLLEDTHQGDAQQLVSQVFHELVRLEQEASQAIEQADPRRPVALLVEPNANERGLLAGYLRTRGFDTTATSNGRDALDYLSLHALPDFVVLDMQVTRCGGRCFLKHVRTTDYLSALKVIGLSDVDLASLGVSLGSGGVDQWFRKPIDPEHLVAEMTGALGWPLS